MRSLDKFYRYIENREPAVAEGDGAAVQAAVGTNAGNGTASLAAPVKTGSRYVIRNGVTVAVPRELTPPPQPEPEATMPAEEGAALEPRIDTEQGETEAIWQTLPPRVRRLARLSADLQPGAAAQTPERRQLIERLLNPLLTLEDTARLLGVCTATVRRYANKGTLPHQRTIGQQRRFLLSDVLELLEARNSGTDSEEKR